MWIINTSFVFDRAVEGFGIEWLRAAFVPAVTDAIAAPLVLRVVSPTDAESVTVAVQTQVDNPAVARDWLKGRCGELVAELGDLFPDRALAFSTIMRQI